MSVRAFALPALPLLALAGCRSYEPMPLDPLAASAAWSARSPDDERVRDFAARIDASESRSVGGFDPRDGLTMEEGEPVAVVFNRRLRVLREQAKVPLATAEFIGLWEDPVLGIELERILESVSNPWIVAASVGVTIPISGRLDAAQALAGAEYAAMLQEIAAQEWRTRIELRERWVEWSAQRLRAELTNGLSSRLQRVDEIARRQQEAGVLSRIDARVFAVKLAQSEADAIAAAAMAQELELELRDVLGIAPDAPVELVPSLRAEPRVPIDGDLRREMIERSLELAAMRRAYDSAEAALMLEIREQYPDLTIGPGAKYEDGGSRVLLGLSLPMPIWNRNQLGVSEALASRDAARARYESTLEHLGSRLAVALVSYRSGVAVRESFETRAVPLADLQDAEVEKVASLGRVDPLLTLESIQAQFDAKMRLIDARRGEAIGAIRVDGIVGPPSLPPSPSTLPRSAPNSNERSPTPGDGT